MNLLSATLQAWLKKPASQTAKFGSNGEETREWMTRGRYSPQAMRFNVLLPGEVDC